MMFRHLLDDKAIEFYFSPVMASAMLPNVPAKSMLADSIESRAHNSAAADRKRFFKRLLAEADALGLSVYSDMLLSGEIMLSVSIGDCLALDAPGKLGMLAKRGRIEIKCLNINKPFIVCGEMQSRFVACSLDALGKFGWEKCPGHGYRSPENTFDFQLSMLPDWVEQLKSSAAEIARIKKQIEKNHKKAEIAAERLQ